MSDELWLAAVAAAKERDESLSEEIRKFLRRYVRRRPVDERRGEGDRVKMAFQGGADVVFQGVNVFGSDAKGYSFSVNQVWYPGIYDSAETCRHAATVDPVVLESLQHIWRFDGENRPATMADLSG